MYEAVGPFFLFVRGAAFIPVIRSLPAERSFYKNPWWFLEDAYVATLFYCIYCCNEDWTSFFLTYT